MGDNAVLQASDFLDSEEGHLTFMIGNIHNSVTNRANRVFSKYDLTLRQVMVCGLLFKYKEQVITQKTLEDRLHLSNPTITVLIQNMRRKGLITREKIPEDGRMYRLRLTEKTQALCEQAFSEMVCEESRFFCGVTPEEKELLRRILGKIEYNLGFSSRT